VLALVLLAAGARAGGVPAEAVVASLPFERVEPTNYIVVDLAPEGRRFPLILDTGASFSVLTPGFARELRVPIRRLKDAPYRRKTRLGRDLEFLIDTRSSDTGARMGFEYGLLGANFLQHYVVELDFTKRTVRFLDPERFAVPEQPSGSEEAVVPIELPAGRPLLEVELDGRPLSLVLDSGAQMPLLLSGAAARSLGVDPDALPVLGHGASARGPVEMRFHEVRSLTIGGLAVGPVAATVAPRGMYNQGSATDSLLGYDVLSCFLVRIDYPRKRLWLRRESSEVPYLGLAYRPMHEVGVLLQQDGTGELEVMTVRPGGIAERRGLRRGDQVLRDGPDGRRRSLGATLAALRDGGTLRVVRWEDGIPNDVPLAPLGAAEEGDTSALAP
jgi:predicted aspartyl protease